MKAIFIFLLGITFGKMPGSTVTWLGNIDTARTTALKERKLILISFSGSDWCGPCIRLRKEILESSDFVTYAADKLVLVRADFPRKKQNQLSPEQIKLNEGLAEKYNPEGKFPFTLLVDPKGSVLKSWEGFPGVSIPQFIAAIDQFHGN